MGGMPPPGGAPMGAPMGAPRGAPRGAPPGPPMESAENNPPTAAESLDYDSMKALAVESGCDDELIKLLEDMSAKDHFNKITPKDGSK